MPLFFNHMMFNYNVIMTDISLVKHARYLQSFSLLKPFPFLTIHCKCTFIFESNANILKCLRNFKFQLVPDTKLGPHLWFFDDVFPSFWSFKTWVPIGSPTKEEFRLLFTYDQHTYKEHIKFGKPRSSHIWASICMNYN